MNAAPFEHRTAHRLSGNRAAARLALGGAGVLLGGALVHVVPGIATLRRFRCAALPALSGVGDPGHVALTFDDGPDPASTPTFLDALDALAAAGRGDPAPARAVDPDPATGTGPASATGPHPATGTGPVDAGEEPPRWRATFFLLGEQVHRYPDLAAEVARRGHEIAVHGHEHRNHLLRSARWTRSDLSRAVDAIGEATGRAPSWYRPPYGALAASSLVAAREQGLPLVLWTSWGRDWQASATPQSVAAEVAGSWRAGATVLLHDSDITSAPGSWRATLGALPILAERWNAAGLTAGPLAEHGIRGRLPASGLRR